MSDDSKRIETHGDQSPGQVGRDYIVNLNQTFVDKRAEIARKQWRALDEIYYPALVDNQERRQRYASQLLIHLHRAFKDSGYVSFTSLVCLAQRKLEGQDDLSPGYSLVTHQTRFTGALRKTWNFLWARKH